MVYSEGDLLASAFGSLYSHLKRLEKWDEIKLENLERDEHLEKEIIHKKKELEELKYKFENEQSRVDSECAHKFGNQIINGLQRGDRGWKQAVRSHYKGFYTGVNDLHQKVKHKEKEIDELRKKTRYSLSCMAKDLRFILNECYHIQDIVGKIKPGFPSISFRILEQILLDVEKFGSELSQKTGLLRHNLAHGHSDLAGIKEDTHCLLILVDDEKKTKKELERIRHELARLKRLQHPEQVFNNLYNFEGGVYKLFISSRAGKVLKHNPYIIKMLRKNLLFHMIQNGRALLSTGHEETDAWAHSTKSWRLLPGRILRGDVAGFGRIFFEIKGNDIFIGDITLPGEHDTRYMAVCQIINTRKYSTGAGKELKIFPEHISL
ncbi:hypothetical protein KY348_02450 [Candidatus Woesearchaeota archaeon]|nr:hypothetical protein [Candidatus Woesearchaeota archaeon]